MTHRCLNYVLIVIILAITSTIYGQTLNISNTTIFDDSKERSAIKVAIAPETKSVKKAFKNFMDDRYNVSIEGIGFLKNKDVLYTEPMIISPISPEVMKLYNKVVKENGQTVMYVYGQLGYNNQITPYANATEYAALKDLTVEFLNDLLPDYYKEIVEEQREEIVDLEDDRDDMQKQISKNKDEIAKLQKENEELEQKLVVNETKIEQNVDELAKKKATLKKVNSKLDKNNF